MIGQEVRMQGMLSEIEAQRSLLATRAAQIAGELAVQMAELEKLRQPKESTEAA